jgi:hypothetical protein
MILSIILLVLEGSVNRNVVYYLYNTLGLGTAAAAAEGGRNTRVLGDPMVLIRCKKLPGKAQWHTVQTSTN